MAYTFPDDVDARPIAIVGAGTLGRRIATMYAAGGSEVRIVCDPGSGHAVRMAERDRAAVDEPVQVDPDPGGTE